MRLFVTRPSLSLWLFRKATGWWHVSMITFCPSDVAAEVFYSPDRGQECFLTVGEFDFHAAKGSTGVGHDTLVGVVLLCQGRTETVRGEARLEMELFVFVWVGQTGCRAEFFLSSDGKIVLGVLSHSKGLSLRRSSMRGLAISA